MTTARDLTPENVTRHEAATHNTQAARKAFVEPTISSPVDVLEATTFFQTVDSGGTGIRRRSGE